MSNYKRFISYIYEYDHFQKGSNRGFVKVECRNDVCKLHFALKGLCENTSDAVSLYALCASDSGLSGSLLASIPLNDGAGNPVFQFPSNQMGDHACSMEDLSGLLLLWKKELFYATQWIDDPMDFPGFLDLLEKPVPDTPSSTPDKSENPPPDSEVIPDEVPSPPNELPGKDHPSPVPDDLQATSATAASPAKDTFFKDGSLIDCRKITLCDLKKLDPADWHLSDNRFLQYGYQMFGHLLIGTLASTGQTILGVPGSYHQKECSMANLFGFTRFLRCPGKVEYPQCFGYWYRLIHPTDLR